MVKVIIIDKDKNSVKCSLDNEQFNLLLKTEDFKPEHNKTIKDLHENIRKFLKGE